MSKCENCIHYDACEDWANVGNLNELGFPFECEGDTKPCAFFKDNSLFVEVVRCKDCIHRYKPTKCALWYATVGNVEYFTDRGEDFYCEWGETQEQVERKLREVGE